MAFYTQKTCKDHLHEYAEQQDVPPHLPSHRSGSLIAVSGGLVYRAVDRGVFSALQGPAYEPWQNWREPQAGPLNLVRAAILAANPHNMQPWRFRVGDDQIDLYVDTTRNIGAVDPLRCAGIRTRVSRRILSPLRLRLPASAT